MTGGQIVFNNIIKMLRIKLLLNDQIKQMSDETIIVRNILCAEGFIIADNSYSIHCKRTGVFGTDSGS